MLTSFFSKSKPINFIVVAAYMLGFYIWANSEGAEEFSLLIFLKELGGFVLFILSLVLVNFISKRNNLTSRNAYKTILFAAFSCMFLAVLKNPEAIAANFLVLLALRRIVSLRSHRHAVQKIFDATFWIGLASIFYFWSILFVIVVYFGILIHEWRKFNNWFVPVIALLTLLSLTTSLELLINNSFYTFPEWFESSNLDFSGYRKPLVLIPLAIILAITIWSSLFYSFTIGRANTSNKGSLFIVLLFTLVSLIVAIFAPTKNSSELIFFFAPLAIIVTNYFQASHDKWFREILLWIVVLLPAVLLIFFS